MNSLMRLVSFVEKLNLFIILILSFTLQEAGI